jgi:hypothetical protein
MMPITASVASRIFMRLLRWSVDIASCLQVKYLSVKAKIAFDKPLILLYKTLAAGYNLTALYYVKSVPHLAGDSILVMPEKKT